MMRELTIGMRVEIGFALSQRLSDYSRMIRSAFDERERQHACICYMECMQAQEIVLERQS